MGVSVRLYGPLADFVRAARKSGSVVVPLSGRASVKDVLESLGVPHTEVDVVLVDGEAVLYRCLSTRLHPGVSDLIRLEPGQLFMVDEYTDPAFRRRGLTRRLAVGMARPLLAAGVREVLGIHRTDNHDTIAAS